MIIESSIITVDLVNAVLRCDDAAQLVNRQEAQLYRRDSARCVKRPFKVTQGHPLVVPFDAAYMTSY